MAGYFTEYSGFKFALFFLGEYVGMFVDLRAGDHAVSGRMVGAACRFWAGCRRGSGSFAKVELSICVFIWVRGTLPRLRQDQLMNFAWKFVLPMTLLNLMVAALWRFMGEGWLRWVVCSAILMVVYV